MLLVLLFKLYQLIRLTRQSDKSTDVSYKLVYLNDSNTAFSFFNFLFIGTKAEGRETIIKHELVHIAQKHSADIVFIEILKIINWFNPFIYILQHSLKAIHEYIADEMTAASETDALTYSSFLVHNAYGLSGSSITHSFFNYNLLKKRIIMLNQKRSGSLARLKYLLAVPICAGLLCASTLAFSKDYGWIVLKQKADTVVKPLPPPPVKPKLIDVKLLPPPPPPPPNAKNLRFATPANPSQVTKKGYKYAESGFLVNGKSDSRVIIVEKDGTQTSYFKSTASPKQIKMLRDKYGYSFSNMSTHTKLPPPPSAPVLAAPPADVAPKTSIDVRPSPQSSSDLKPATTIKSGKAITVSIDTAAFNTVNPGSQMPTIVINGWVYRLKDPLKKGQKLTIHADSVSAVVYTDNDLQRVIKKYGEGAKNGVIYAFGKTSISGK